MNKEDCERPKNEEYLTYLDEDGFKTVGIDSYAVHPDKSILVEIVFGKKPVFRFNLESLGLYEFLDLIGSHVYRCEEDCKKILEESKNRRRKTY